MSQGSPELPLAPDSSGEEPFSTWDKSVLSLIHGAIYSLPIRKAHFPVLGEVLAEMELSEDSLKSRLCNSGIAEGSD